MKHTKEYKREYYLKNEEHIKEYQREYYKKNKEKILLDAKKWKEENRDKWNTYQAMKARERNGKKPSEK